MEEDLCLRQVLDRMPIIIYADEPAGASRRLRGPNAGCIASYDMCTANRENIEGRQALRLVPRNLLGYLSESGESPGVEEVGYTRPELSFSAAGRTFLLRAPLQHHQLNPSTQSRHLSILSSGLRHHRWSINDGGTPCALISFGSTGL